MPHRSDISNRVAGFVGPFISPEWFIAEQIAFSPLEDVSLGAKMVAYQLGNIYLLLAMVGIAVLYTTTEAKVVHNYVIALWLADIGHVAITCYVMEYERVVDIASWNAMAWGNIGATVGRVKCVPVCMLKAELCTPGRTLPLSISLSFGLIRSRQTTTQRGGGEEDTVRRGKG